MSTTIPRKEEKQLSRSHTVHGSDIEGDDAPGLERNSLQKGHGREGTRRGRGSDHHRRQREKACSQPAGLKRAQSERQSSKRSGSHLENIPHHKRRRAVSFCTPSLDESGNGPVLCNTRPRPPSSPRRRRDEPRRSQGESFSTDKQTKSSGVVKPVPSPMPVKFKSQHDKTEDEMHVRGRLRSVMRDFPEMHIGDTAAVDDDGSSVTSNNDDTTDEDEYYDADDYDTDVEKRGVDEASRKNEERRLSISEGASKLTRTAEGAFQGTLRWVPGTGVLGDAAEERKGEPRHSETRASRPWWIAEYYRYEIDRADTWVRSALWSGYRDRRGGPDAVPNPWRGKPSDNR